MAIRSRLTSEAIGGTPTSHSVTLWIAFDPGGGPPGTTHVNATINWDPNALTNPTTTSSTRWARTSE
jgi:hypothetical protein